MTGRNELFCLSGAIVLLVYLACGNPSEMRQVGIALGVIMLGCTAMILRAIRERLP